MGDIISVGQPSANVQHRRCNTIEELGSVSTLAVCIIASSDNIGQLHLVVIGGAARFEVLASADHAPDHVAALRALGKRVIRTLEIAELEFSVEFYHPQME
ncbi:hypothetical protein [Methylobacterium nigriterrae]|uniref:hypothetical protein n=1 Tax=Methylobacterium nigriterrae TaxID=3127512 RepID=UPI00301380EC